MDAVKRTYARAQLVGTDPLQGVSLELRRALLFLPMTWRERWRLSPLRTRDSKRAAITEILAERRLKYELFYSDPPKASGSIVQATPEPQPSAMASTALSPYYRHRLSLHALRDERNAQDVDDIADPRAAASLRNHPHHRKLLQLRLERARLEVKELELLTQSEPLSPEPAALPPPDKARTRSRRRERDR